VDVRYLLIIGAFLLTSGVTSPAAPTETKWHLTWSDEFNAPNGTPPDPKKWTYELGANGWLNQELESYTARPANAEQRDGNLVITAQKEEFTGADGIPAHYTSSRLRTLGLFSQTYGRFEARIQLPLGKGIWPAFWMMGADIVAKPWPACGEIDIFENIGEANRTYSSIHGPGYSATKGITKRLVLPEGQAVNTAFHLYAVEWKPNNIRFYVDDVLVVERTPADLPPGTKWVYDHPFFMLLNVAVGGSWPGSPDATTSFPQRMLVDYVRVYSENVAKTL
jgi:beta-glucanase (GH16 family)